MPKFTNTQSVSHYLNEIIDKSSGKVILISPYVRLNESLADRLQFIDKSGTTIYIVYKTGNLKEFEIELFSTFNNIKLYEKDNLHAKCYMNERMALITSMNLYQFSQQNNVEFGLLINNEDDGESFQDLKNEVNRLIASSKPISLKRKSIIYNFNSTSKIDHVSVRIKMLKGWRRLKTEYSKMAPETFLTNEIVNQIAFRPMITRTELQTLLKDAPVDYFQQTKIMEIFYFTKNYRIASVVSTQSVEDEKGYDQVKLKFLDTELEEILYTKMALPLEKTTIAMAYSSNGWLNEYYDIT